MRSARSTSSSRWASAVVPQTPETPWHPPGVVPTLSPLRARRVCLTHVPRVRDRVHPPQCTDVRPKKCARTAFACARGLSYTNRVSQCLSRARHSTTTPTQAHMNRTSVRASSPPSQCISRSSDVSRQVIVIQFVLGRQLAKVSGAHRRHYTRARAAAAAPTPAG